MVSTRRCHMPHYSSEYGFIARDIPWPRKFLSWRYQLAIKIMRFDTIRLFLWGYAKYRVYADKHATFELLKTNICQIMAEIPPNMCKKVLENSSKESTLATWSCVSTHNFNVQTLH